MNDPKFLKLPYDTWSALLYVGIADIAILETIKDQQEYRIRVPYGDRHHTLHLKHDGDQMRVLEASSRFPKRLINTLNWRFSFEVTKRAIAKLIEADAQANPDTFDWQTSFDKASAIVFEK